MKGVTWFLLTLLAVAPLYATPKVDVRVKVNERIVKNVQSETLSRGATSFYVDVWYFNIAVTSDNADAVAKGNGQWRIKGDTQLATGEEYKGTLDGDALDILIPDKNGKNKALHYEAIEHKWRKLADISG